MGGCLEKSEKPGPIYTWGCTLDGRAEINPAQLVQWAEQVVAADRHSWSQHILALAYYRAGRFEEALAQANQSNAHQGWLGHYMNWPLLAIVHHRLGHAAEARKWLDEANEFWRKLSPLAQAIDSPIVLPSTDPWWQDPITFQDWPIYEMHLAEASTLILGHRGEADCLDLLHRAYLHTKLGESRKADEEFQAAL